MKVALILSAAFVTTKPDFPARERRIRQYLNGLGQIAEVSAQYPVFDVYSVDNTVEDPATLEIQIVEALHRIRGFRSSVHFFDNDLGQSNRGSGGMVQWMTILPDLVGKYEYVVHY